MPAAGASWVLWAQRGAGNAAVSRLLSGARSSDSPVARAHVQRVLEATAPPAPAAGGGAAPAFDDVGFKALLKRVTDKTDALIAAMSPQEKQAAHALLSAPDADLKGIEKALHFGEKKERKGSDPAHRVTVRRKLLEFLAAGGTSGDAIGYRAKLTRMTGEHIGDLKPVASQTGVMKLVPLLGGLTVPAENEGLTQEQVQTISDVFDDVMTTVKYNSAAVPLRFIQKLREAKEKDPTVRMEDVFNAAVVNDKELFDAAGGADCVGMAAIVRDRLAAEGIGCHVIGTTSGNYLNQLPSHTRDRVGWQEAKDFAVYSHASVAIPYTDEQGVPRAIHIETGMGPDRKFFTQFKTLAEANQGLGGKRYDTSQAVDPAALAKKHVRCKWRMYLSDVAGQDRKVFVDLIEGSVWLSGTPADEMKRFRQLSGTEAEGTKLNFEEALRRPSEEVVIETGAEDLTVTASDAVELFMRVVALKFGLPQATFVREMMWLARNAKEFRETVMLDPVAVINELMPIRRRALAAQDAAGQATGSAHARAAARGTLDQADAALADALRAANGGDRATATTRYTDAIALFGQAATEGRGAVAPAPSPQKEPA